MFLFLIEYLTFILYIVLQVRNRHFSHGTKLNLKAHGDNNERNY